MKVRTQLLVQQPYPRRSMHLPEVISPMQRLRTNASQREWRQKRHILLKSDVTRDVVEPTAPPTLERLQQIAEPTSLSTLQKLEAENTSIRVELVQMQAHNAQDKKFWEIQLAEFLGLQDWATSWESELRMKDKASAKLEGNLREAATKQLQE